MEIIVELKIAEGHYVKGCYLQAYESLYRLCCDNKHCEEQFFHQAMNILSRFNDVERSSTITSGLELSQTVQMQREIGIAFEKLLCQMKRFCNSQQGLSAYDEHELRIKEQRTMLRKSLMAVEDDISDCDNPKKTELLQKIKEQLLKVIDYFSNLIKNFRMVKDCE